MDGHRGDLARPSSTAEPCEKVSGTRIPVGGRARVATQGLRFGSHDSLVTVRVCVSVTVLTGVARLSTRAPILLKDYYMLFKLTCRSI